MFKRVLLVSTILLSAPVLYAQPYSISDAKAEGPSTPRLIVLRDERGGIEAAICPEQGGELSGMRVLFRGRWVELLDKARDYRPSEDWRGKAPLLWPATGRTAPNGYNWKGKFYPMPAHGFVQNMPWKLESKHSDPNEAVAMVSLEDTPETRKMYPFGFRIVVEYRLSRGKLALAYTVRAADGNREPMFFSIGNHITFRTPLIEGGDASKMLFYTPATLEIVKSPERLPTGETRAWSLAGPAELGGLARNGCSLPPATSPAKSGPRSRIRKDWGSAWSTRLRLFRRSRLCCLIFGRAKITKRSARNRG